MVSGDRVRPVGNRIDRKASYASATKQQHFTSPSTPLKMSEHTQSDSAPVADRLHPRRAAEPPAARAERPAIVPDDAATKSADEQAAATTKRRARDRTAHLTVRFASHELLQRMHERARGRGYQSTSAYLIACGEHHGSTLGERDDLRAIGCYLRELREEVTASLAELRARPSREAITTLTSLTAQVARIERLLAAMLRRRVSPRTTARRGAGAASSQLPLAAPADERATDG